MLFATRCKNFPLRGICGHNSRRLRLMGFSSRSAVVVFFVVSVMTCAMGQRGTMGRAGSSTRSGTSHRPNTLPAGLGSGRGMLSDYGAHRSNRYESTYASLPFPFFGDAFDPNDIYSSGYPVASEPPEFVLQAARELSASTAYRSGQPGSSSGERDAVSSTQPLMIELQNGRYVRVNATPADGEARELDYPAELAIRAQSEPNQHLHSAQRVATDSPPRGATAAISSAMQDLPSALLVFRDGHIEQVRDYTIADGVLYARGDFYTDGYWNKKIDLFRLNLTATLKENADRNVKFVLPSSPNEVVTRP